MDFESILRTLQPFIVLFIALFAAFLTATWVSAVIWTFRDIRSRTRDIFAQILATLMVLIFFPLFPIPGLVLYLLLRPRETLAEIYERTLEEEALLQGIEERLACPGCSRSIEEDFIVCPTCHTRLKKPCIACGRSLNLSWSICPFCGASQSQAVSPPPEAIILPPEEPIASPRLAEPATTSQFVPAEIEFEPEDDTEYSTVPQSVGTVDESPEQDEQHMEEAWEARTEADPDDETSFPAEPESDLIPAEELEAEEYQAEEPEEEVDLGTEPAAGADSEDDPKLEPVPQPDSESEDSEPPLPGEEPEPGAGSDDEEEEPEPQQDGAPG